MPHSVPDTFVFANCHPVTVENDTVVVYKMERDERSTFLVAWRFADGN